MRFLKPILIIAAACLSQSFISQGQIQIDQLNAASAYDGGVLDETNGGLDNALWQNTTALRAAKLIAEAPELKSGTADELFRAALLSGGVPPIARTGAERELYVNTKLGALLQRGELEKFDLLARLSGTDQTIPAYRQLFADRALLSGHVVNACGIGDTISEFRTMPYWAKLRAYCHYGRGEIPAAELTADLLRRNEQGDPAFFALIGILTGSRISAPDLATVASPLHIAMTRDYLLSDYGQKIKPADLPPVLAAEIAMSGEYQAADRLAALTRSAHLLRADQIDIILRGFGVTPLDNFDNLKTVKTWTAPVWGQAYDTLKSGVDMGTNTVVVTEMLRRADDVGMFGPMADVLASDISVIPPSLRVAENPLLFAKLATRNRDFGTLGELYRSLTEDKPVRARIALASDALGGGFRHAPLGTDIESRLAAEASTKNRAVRDTYIAIALGASLSDQAADVLAKRSATSGRALPAGKLLALRDAARRGAKAETVLRAAELIGTSNLSDLRDQDFAAILFAFDQAGLYDLAGSLAARDFLDGTP